MSNNELQLLACYESNPYEGEISPFRQLHGSMAPDDFGHYLSAQFMYGSKSSRYPSISHAVQNLLERKSLVLGGGIVAIKGGFVLLPGCCSGIESWRTWRNIKNGSPSPWMGHDPDPWIDTSGNKAILHNGRKGKNSKITVTYNEIQLALDKVEKELGEFLKGLELWLRNEGVSNSVEVSRKIDRSYQITKEYSHTAIDLALVVD